MKMCMEFLAATGKLIGTLGTAARCNALKETISNLHAGIADETDYEVLLDVLSYTTGWEIESLRRLFNMAEEQEYMWDTEEDECPD